MLHHRWRRRSGQSAARTGPRGRQSDDQGLRRVPESEGGSRRFPAWEAAGTAHTDVGKFTGSRHLSVRGVHLLRAVFPQVSEFCRCPAVRLSASRFGVVLGSVLKDHRVVDHGGVIRRHELTDLEWELLAPLIPRAATGRPRVEDRQVVNGMVYKIRTGVSWRDLPERYGPWKTVYTRFRRYALDGVFTRALQQIQAHADAVGDIDWLVQIDSTIVRAHQHAAATGRKGNSLHVLARPTRRATGRPSRSPRLPGPAPSGLGAATAGWPGGHDRLGRPGRTRRHR